MNHQQNMFFDVKASEVVQPANSDSRRIFEFVDGEPVPAPLTSPLRREEYEQLLGVGLPVTFTIRVHLADLLTLGSDLTGHLAELVFNNEAKPQVCDYRVIGASYGKFADTYSGYVHLQVSCLLNAF